MLIQLGLWDSVMEIGKLDEAAENCTRESESLVVESGTILAVSRVAWGR